MALRIVLDEQQLMLVAKLLDGVGIGTNAIEMHQQHCAGARRDGALEQSVIDLHIGHARFNQHGCEPVLDDGED